ncbi:UBP-type zinc finger domain-containing protein [Chitinophaga sp. GCM10012297]|uniref:UBP-type zinc finger domain-containing protein n=1 Tax=Chitinophaga chungangae TaxID=2821488 RepID=A0ABS3YHC1_9BACT|nr:UBP-type zinc finger domain-containing protein [Chitinophaga chungangae]MBO9154039.1 UBP-type zinc finger domain-containing protein [Chitinophaga chungangae]
MGDSPCKHIRGLDKILQPKAYECEECVKNGKHDWLHLRTCQTCGGTFCCDNSPSKHMTAHFHATGHPVIISAEPGEQWLWCYLDEDFVEY